MDTAGRGIAEMMGIVRALGVKSKVVQQEESGRLVIVAPSPKKRKRK